MLMSAKTITFDFNFWKHKRPFRKPSVAEIQKIEDKCSYYSKAGYDAFMTGSANPKHWTDYDRWIKPAELSEDVADSPVYRFKINQKIRVFAVLNEITENNVTAFILWIDPNHKSG
jgi:hypothetical protein